MKLPHVLLCLVLVAAIVGCTHADRVKVFGQQDAAKIETDIVSGLKTAGATHALGENWPAATVAAKWQTQFAGAPVARGGASPGRGLDTSPGQWIQTGLQKAEQWIQQKALPWLRGLIPNQWQPTSSPAAQRPQEPRPQVNEALRQQALRERILARAEAWVAEAVPYSQGTTRDEYRTDCSGFVGMAWELPNASGGPDTTSFVSGGYATKIDKEDLLPGDAINNERSGNDGHIVLFVEWLDEEHTTFRAYDEHSPEGASDITLHFVLLRNEWTILEYEAAGCHGPFYAMRRRPEWEPDDDDRTPEEDSADAAPHAQYVRDITYPDCPDPGGVVSPGQEIVKTWQLTFSGTDRWPEGSALVFVRGDQMGAPDSVPVTVPPQDGLGEVNVSMVAPTEPGTYKGIWRLRGPDQTVLSSEIYVLICVE